MILAISSFEILNVLIPDSKNFFWIAIFSAAAATVNPSSVKTLLAIGSSTYFIKDKSVFSNGLKSLQIHPPAFTILESWVFENFCISWWTNSKSFT